MTLPATLGPFIYDLLYFPRHRFEQRLAAALNVVREHLPEKVDWVREHIMIILNTEPTELASEKCPKGSHREEMEWLQTHPIYLRNELVHQFFNDLGLSTWLLEDEFNCKEYEPLGKLVVDQENLHKWGQHADPFGMRWHLERTRCSVEFDKWYYLKVCKVVLTEPIKCI